MNFHETSAEVLFEFCLASLSIERVFVQMLHTRVYEMDRRVDMCEITEWLVLCTISSSTKDRVQDVTEESIWWSGFLLVGESEAEFPRRSRIGTMVCILGNSGRDSGMARLTQICDLTSSQFDLYKGFLVESGLLEISSTENGVEVLRTTLKGGEFLREYGEIEGLDGP